MKKLNFTTKEKLFYLLNLKAGDEIQTIRKAWKKIEGELREPITHKASGTGYMLQDKPPTYKVGDEVPIVWFESKYPWMCQCNPLNSNGLMNNCLQKHKEKVFNTDLGKIRITEVFEIEMFRFTEEPETICVTYVGENRPTMTSEDMEKLAKRDGFKSDIQLIKYFEENYIPKDDTSTKKFYVYRGVKIE